MRTEQLATVAAWAALAAWALKALAIWAAGGLGQSPIESLLFFAGLLAYVVGAFCFGYAAVVARRTVLRAVTGVVAVVALLALISLLQAVARATLPDSAGWVTEEAGLWLSAAVLVTVSQWRLSRTPLRGLTA
jgi:hypothetical protein